MNQYRVMDTQIFSLGLSVLALSAYILACSLIESGVPPSRRALSERWNASEGDLDGALAELQAWDVLERRKGPEEECLFFPAPASLWRQPAPTGPAS
jgi:hypothetical protein